MAKEKFFITARALVDGKVVIQKQEIEGTRLKNEYGLDVFSHKAKGGYRISEATSGFSMTHTHALKRDAVADFEKNMENKDIEQVKTKIKEATEQVNAEIA